MNVEIRCESRNYNTTMGFAAFTRGRDGEITHCAQPLVMTPIEEAVQTCDFAEISLDQPALTRLMDDLWRAGVRPSQIGTTGHLAALEAHLQTVQLVAQSASIANHDKDALIAEVVRASLPK